MNSTNNKNVSQLFKFHFIEYVESAETRRNVFQRKYVVKYSNTEILFFLRVINT